MGFFISQEYYLTINKVYYIYTTILFKRDYLIAYLVKILENLVLLQFYLQFQNYYMYLKSVCILYIYVNKTVSTLTILHYYVFRSRGVCRASLMCAGLLPPLPRICKIREGEINEFIAITDFILCRAFLLVGAATSLLSVGIWC